VVDERRKTSPATKIALRRIQLDYRSRVLSGQPLPAIWDTGFRVFSEFDEDGVTLFLLSVDGSNSRRFVDIGAGDGVFASNTANLALNLGFHGLLIDANGSLVERGRRFYARHPDTMLQPPAFVHAAVTPDNVNELVRGAGFEGEIDLLSIDIDGNDYWIWEALTCVTPRFVLAEAHTMYGLEDWVMPYQPDFDARSARAGVRIGASPVAMGKLAQRLGYRMVGANLYGFNIFYARNDVAEMLPAIDVEQLFRHVSYRTPEGTVDAGG
jgi:hypothetical protein